jgi:hypothetical protein
MDGSTGQNETSSAKECCRGLLIAASCTRAFSETKAFAMFAEKISTKRIWTASSYCSNVLYNSFSS